MNKEEVVGNSKEHKRMRSQEINLNFQGNFESKRKSDFKMKSVDETRESGIKK